MLTFIRLIVINTGWTKPIRKVDEPLNCLLEQIALFCSAHLLDEKILISPSLAVGSQLVESLARNGQPWVNLRVETIRTLAIELVGEDLAAFGRRLLSRAQSLALVEQSCSQVLESASYFGQLRDCPGFYRALQKTLDDLRMSAIPTNVLLGAVLETEHKAGEISAIAEAYALLLEQNGFIDSMDVLKLALEKAKAQEWSSEVWYLVPDGLDAIGIERELLESLASERLYVIPTDNSDFWSDSPAQVSISRALGEENEVREVFRQVLRDDISFDSTEIIYTDSVTYIPLIYELASQYGVPCTFAQGIPVTFSRPGQAAIGILEWLKSGYDANILRRIVAEGCIDFGSVTVDGNPPGALPSARVIREASIGWGSNRHIPCLDAVLRDYERRLAQCSDTGSGDDLSKELLQEKHRAAMAVCSFVVRLLELFTTDDTNKVDCIEFATGLAQFLREFAMITSEVDGTAASALSNILAEIAEIPRTQTTLQQAVERLREAVVQTYVGASTPEPGHIHVNEYRSGGYSGRACTFVIGLDESRHPGRDMQDPVLLDSERIRLNQSIGEDGLPLMADCPVENAAAMRACLARLRGKVTLSFSCRDIVGDRELFPSAIVLEAFRRLTGDADADYSKMLSALPPPGGFAAKQDVYLDETEWWLSALKDTRSSYDVSDVVRNIYPWLGSGWKAEQERENAILTEYDGLLGIKVPELDPCGNGAAVSASSIEALARCPFAYYARFILGIQPVEDRTFDPARWLDARESGILMHEVFRRFMQEITLRKEKPSLDRHLEELSGIAESLISEYKEIVPPPNRAAFKAQHDDIIRTCSIFLKMEEEHCKLATPLFFEVPFGYPGASSNSSLACDVPVSIELGNGSRFLFAGRIDRVDKVEGGLYEIWDYKTGSSRSIKEESAFDGGRQLQHVLYAAAMNQLLEDAGMPGRVVRSGYFFPALKAEGARVVREPDQAGMQDILINLFNLLKGGVFSATIDATYCKYCDYSVACGGPQASRRSKMKLDNPANTILEPIRRLTGNGI